MSNIGMHPSVAGMTDEQREAMWECLAGATKALLKSRPASKRGRGRKTLALRAEVLSIFEDFDGSMSTRQVFYQLVSRGAVENKPAEYGRVQRLLVQMRRDGDVDYERVVDRTRGKHQRAGWDGAEDVMEAVSAQYRRNLWAEQSNVVMVACEKQALEGVFAEVVDEYGASLWVLRGYASASFAFEWATEIKRLRKSNRNVVIAYFGDHDPSGIDIERDTQDELASHGADFYWQRYGLLEEDFDRFNLVNVPVKNTDTRARKYLGRYGNRAAELDALRPDELRGRIRTAITEYINPGPWQRLREIEAVERESLRAVTDNWDLAVQAVQP